MSLVQLGSPRFDPATGPPCHDCSAKCCKYFSLEIDTPRTPKDHDHIRWYLMHQQVVVWVQDGSWHLEIRTPCKNLLPDNRCAVYDTRPQICRDYGWPDAEHPDDDPCEYFTGEGGYDLYFDSAESFEAWSSVELARREQQRLRRRTKRAAAATALALAGVLAAGVARADSAADVFKQMGIKTQDVMNSSVATARVLPGDAKQVVAVVTYLTGKKDEVNALGVRLEVYRTEGRTLVPIFSRDAGKENGGYVGRGEVALLDLDGDGVNEIGFYYDNLKNNLIEDRVMEVIVHDGDGFRVAWSGSVTYDATKAVREIPAERRDRYLRKLDLGNTRRTKGVTLFMTKTMVAVAGERLPQPQQVQETFPLKPAVP